MMTERAILLVPAADIPSKPTDTTSGTQTPSTTVRSSLHSSSTVKESRMLHTEQVL